ncbi:aminotransferase class I/II-fold pyridoxal phosphate-dependent enzyme [Mediterraneibacter sp. ICN-202921]|uniref:aminotransferase class I/II-fold pyridoxal phosphate-dependent enzyme n=1 Tax=Mediterraneibacter sp. ICN-202921 TaxID=3134657 RepID=UPI000E526D01|nr:aminotransferase class I/II-fold pyridoxal phosphate-dependent enzyme [Ruminococcus sp. AF18-22]
MKSLYEELKKYSKSDYYGFHMPGHKRNASAMQADLPYSMDITEIEGFDDLHHPTGILQEVQRRASKIYHAEETSILINGSTVGILSAIMGCTCEGDKILIARNSHKSVYHAVFLNKLVPIYVYPTFYPDKGLNGAVDPEKIQTILQEEQGIKAVVITSPTYDGVLSDIDKISTIVHAHKIPLIVDEAHGAHFGFHPYFPENANQKGADIVIHSLHKTLPALTQTALLHKNGSIVDWSRVCYYLDMLQTSSPSYILMASADVCISEIEKKGKQYFEFYVKLLKAARNRLQELENLRLVQTEEYDFSKLVIYTGNTEYTGKYIYDILLKEYHLQMEMAAGNYVLAMTSPADTPEGMERFCSAIMEIDRKIVSEERKNKNTVEIQSSLPELERKYTSAEIKEKIDLYNRRGCTGNIKSKTWKTSVGHISTEYAYMYPPGIPLVVPGEIISKEISMSLCKFEEAGFEIQGTRKAGEIEVWIDE